jgi:peroxiredoxin
MYKIHRWEFVLMLGGLLGGLFTTFALQESPGKTGIAFAEASPAIGSLAPDFRLGDLNGRTFHLQEAIAKNKVTLLNFWATWCPPCRKEIPELVGFYRDYAKQGVQILAVDLHENPQTVGTFAADQGMVFPVLIDPAPGQVSDQYQILYIPTTFIIDHQGKIRDKIVGGTDRATLEGVVRNILRER